MDLPSTPSTSSQPQDPTTSPKNTPFILLWISIGLTFLLLAAIGGFYLGRMTIKQEVSLEKTIPTSMPTNTSIPTNIPVPTRTNTPTPTQTNMYTACGCGCCEGVDPIKKCIYQSKGESMNKIIQEDKKTGQSSQCSTMGCSIGTEYSYCN